MDCVIPSHSVRSFCAALGCLSKIGKELYVDFDPIAGLSLRTLNDAKSAFCSFHYEPSFFDQCTAPPLRAGRPGKRRAPPPDGDVHFGCRVPLRALTPVVRPRKGVASLRVRSDSSDQQEQLCFEFHLQRGTDGSLLFLTHSIGVAEADHIAAVAPKDGCSEIVTAPKMLLRMLDPLKRTSEVALIVSNDANNNFVTVTSFHHNDHQSKSQNMVLQANTASNLRSETSIGSDEFEDFFFCDDRKTDHGAEDSPAPPEDVNREVTLVFSVKEAKAMLQYCSQAHLDQELRVTISFHWGGRPLRLETKADSFSAELILATLDHKLLEGVKSANRLDAARVSAQAGVREVPSRRYS